MEQTINNSPLAAAAEILADPSLKTSFMGVRLSALRSLTTIAVALSLTVAVSSVAINLAAQESMFHEIQALVDGPQTIDAARVQAQPPSGLHPLLQVGQIKDGRLNVPRLLSAWANAGLNEYGAKMMLISLYGQGPTFQAAPANPLDPHRDGQMSSQDITDLFIKLGGDPALAIPGKPHGWTGVYKVWQALIDDEGFDEHFYEGAQDASIEQAQAEVMLAIEEAGLASLTLPLSTQANPGRMMAYATAIRQINKDLAQTTGWGGQALGLAGRVNLSFSPVAVGVDGETWHRDGKIMIATKWSALSHEWLHGVDFTLSSHAFANPSATRTASAQMGALRIKSSNDSAAAHKQLLHGLMDAAPELEGRLALLDKQVKREYFTSSSEILSRSFEAHMVYARYGKPALGVGNNVEHASYPDQAQAIKQADLWSGWFASIKHLELTTPVSAPVVATYTDFGQMLSSHRQGAAIRAAATSQGVGVVPSSDMDDMITPPRPRSAPH